MRRAMQSKRRIPEAVWWLVAAAFFTSFVLWSFAYYEDTDARRIRNRILEEFAVPCDPETTLFEGKPVAELVEQARSGSEAERRSAVCRLRCVYEGHDRLVSTRSRRLGEEARRWMLWLVERGYVSQRAAVVLPPLILALKDRSAEIRVLAAVTLRDMGAAALPGRGALRESLNDNDARVRLAAVDALHHIRFETEGLVEVVVDVLEHEPDPASRAWAANTLASLGRAAQAAVPALEAALQGGDSALVASAEKALAWIHSGEAPRHR
ncbi:MAG TPA: HEAT repeat domain-containing protein [Planctomycetota bacterium]